MEKSPTSPTSHTSPNKRELRSTDYDFTLETIERESLDLRDTRHKYPHYTKSPFGYLSESERDELALVYIALASLFVIILVAAPFVFAAIAALIF